MLRVHDRLALDQEAAQLVRSGLRNYKRLRLNHEPCGGAAVFDTIVGQQGSSYHVSSTNCPTRAAMADRSSMTAE